MNKAFTVNEDTGPLVDSYIVLVILVAAGFNIVTGVWALVDPPSFADFAGFDDHAHFLHDIGAFQVGLGVMLLLPLIWRDALSAALASFLLANTIHTVNHWVDRHIGGADVALWFLPALSVLTALALQRHARRHGYVFGRVCSATTLELEPFVEQKTVSLTTFRRDGTPVATPVSLAVEGDRAFFRTYEKAGKSRRLARNPSVVVAPSRARGQLTGSPIQGSTRRLDGAETSHAASLLRRKHPLLHGVIVPVGHWALRRKTGKTVHYEFDPLP